MLPLQQNFDITNLFVDLRIVCGLYFIPHIWAAFYVPQAINVFVQNGFKPPAFWLYASAAIGSCSPSDLFSASTPTSSPLLPRCI